MWQQSGNKWEAEVVMGTWVELDMVQGEVYVEDVGDLVYRWDVCWSVVALKWNCGRGWS